MTICPAKDKPTSHSKREKDVIRLRVCSIRSLDHTNMANKTPYQISHRNQRHENNLSVKLTKCQVFRALFFYYDVRCSHIRQTPFVTLFQTMCSFEHISLWCWSFFDACVLYTVHTKISYNNCFPVGYLITFSVQGLILLKKKLSWFISLCIEFSFFAHFSGTVIGLVFKSVSLAMMRNSHTFLHMFSFE